MCTSCTTSTCSNQSVYLVLECGRAVRVAPRRLLLVGEEPGTYRPSSVCDGTLRLDSPVAPWIYATWHLALDCYAVRLVEFPPNLAFDVSLSSHERQILDPFLPPAGTRVRSSLLPPTSARSDLSEMTRLAACEPPRTTLEPLQRPGPHRCCWVALLPSPGYARRLATHEVKNW